MAQSVAEGAGAELVAIDGEGNLTEWLGNTQWLTQSLGSPTYMGP